MFSVPGGGSRFLLDPDLSIPTPSSCWTSGPRSSPFHFCTAHGHPLSPSSSPDPSMTYSPHLRSDQTLFCDPRRLRAHVVPEHLHHCDARNLPSSSNRPSGMGAISPPSSAAPRGPGRPPPSARSLPGLRRPPGRLPRSTSTAGRTTRGSATARWGITVSTMCRETSTQSTMRSPPPRETDMYGSQNRSQKSGHM